MFILKIKKPFRAPQYYINHDPINVYTSPDKEEAKQFSYKAKATLTRIALIQEHLLNNSWLSIEPYETNATNAMGFGRFVPKKQTDRKPTTQKDVSIRF